jgi:hypothetical protein
VVETARLEIVFTVTCNGGSNPPFSAIFLKKFNSHCPFFISLEVFGARTSCACSHRAYTRTHHACEKLEHLKRDKEGRIHFVFLRKMAEKGEMMNPLTSRRRVGFDDLFLREQKHYKGGRPGWPTFTEELLFPGVKKVNPPFSAI